jgi:hypothetical protein
VRLRGCSIHCCSTIKSANLSGLILRSASPSVMKYSDLPREKHVQMSSHSTDGAKPSPDSTSDSEHKPSNSHAAPTRLVRQPQLRPRQLHQRQRPGNRQRPISRLLHERLPPVAFLPESGRHRCSRWSGRCRRVGFRDAEEHSLEDTDSRDFDGKPVVAANRVYIATAVSSAEDNTFRTGVYGDTVPVNDLSEHSRKLYSLDAQNGVSVR